MDRLDAMALLVAAVETGSLSGAGRRLGMPLPTVSRRLSELEARLRTRLIIRSTRRLTLTDAGEAYVAACRRILDQVAEAEREAAGEYSSPRGELIVAAPVAFGRLHVLPAVIEVLERYPEIDVRLVLSDRNARLAEDHIDVAVRIGALPDSALVATRVGEVSRVICASPAYLGRRGEPPAPAALLEHDCIRVDFAGAGAPWTFAGAGSVEVHPRLAVNTAEAAVDAAVAGLGIARVLSYQAAAALNAGQLRRILMDFEREPWPVHLLHAGQSLLPQKTRAFLDLAAPRLRKALASVA